MSDGFRNLVINAQERLVSSDANRMQQFQHRDMAELLRYMMNVSSEDDLAAGAVATEYSAVGDPLRAEIINGVLVRPVGGALDLTVDAGVLMLLSPDGSADESNYKYVKQDAVASGLAMTANASGSVRIDVIECQIDATPGLVTATRDVFNTVTGTFAATLLTKEKYGRLLFRVRAGTPGGGFPGTASGWLPLAVAKVPDGTATNDTITFWDVRPLISDRQFTPFAMTANANLLGLDGQVQRVSATDVRMSGMVHAVYNGRRLGGLIRRGTPGTDADYLNIADTDNQDTGLIVEPLNTEAIYVYLATPFGLPRWARYTDGPSNRTPRSCRGIPIVSRTDPAHFTNLPSAALVLPPSTGLGGSTSEAVCISSSCANSVSQFAGVTFANKIAQYDATAPNVFTASYSGSTFTFTLTDGTYIPTNAKALIVGIAVGLNVSANTTLGFVNSSLRAYRDNTTTFPYYQTSLPRFCLANQTAGTVTRYYDTGNFRLPLPQEWPAAGRTSPRRIEWSTSAGLSIGVNAVLVIYGYEL